MDGKIRILHKTDNVPRIQIKSTHGLESSREPHFEVRRCLRRRNTRFVINAPKADAMRYAPIGSGLPGAMIHRACSVHELGASDDFDYLRRSVRQYQCQITIWPQTIKLDFTVAYATTSQQEKEIEDFLGKLFRENGIQTMRLACQKVKFVYDYIIEHVNYDCQGKRFSAYDALFHKSAVCEGCAALFYRMVSTAGIPCRILTGYGMQERHAWNLVWLDGMWYNCDVTWDLCKNFIQRKLVRYDYFMAGEDKFSGHVRDAEFRTAEFMAEYPIANHDYITSGNVLQISGIPIHHIL